MVFPTICYSSYLKPTLNAVHPTLFMFHSIRTPRIDNVVLLPEPAVCVMTDKLTVPGSKFC
jgi:hypothetical protein